MLMLLNTYSMNEWMCLGIYRVQVLVRTTARAVAFLDLLVRCDVWLGAPSELFEARWIREAFFILCNVWSEPVVSSWQVVSYQHANNKGRMGEMGLACCRSVTLATILWFSLNRELEETLRSSRRVVTFTPQAGISMVTKWAGSCRRLCSYRRWYWYND